MVDRIRRRFYLAKDHQRLLLLVKYFFYMQTWYYQITRNSFVICSSNLFTLSIQMKTNP